MHAVRKCFVYATITTILMLQNFQIEFAPDSRALVPAIALIAASSAAPLTYQEGGEPGSVSDPGLDTSASNRRYVASNGNNNNDGLTQSTPWASCSKVDSEWNNIPAGSIILFRRGDTFGGNCSLENHSGTADNPKAIGAYGACTPSPYFDNLCSNAPRFDGTFSLSGSSWITLRDLSARRYDTSFGAHDILVYRNQAKGPGGGTASNIYRSFADSYHMVFIENVATDADANDYFNAHPDGSGTSNRDGWWYIANICIGTGGEDCIDLAGSNPDLGSDSYTVKDVKVIATRAVGRPLAGYSNLTGRANNCVNTGHFGNFYWWVGNVCMGWQSDYIWNFGRQTDKGDAQISGNVVIGDDGNGYLSRNYAYNQNIYHNTFINGGSSGQVTGFDSNGQRFDYNVVVAMQSGNNSALVDARTSSGQILSMDHNWYGLATGKTITSGDTLSQRQSGTSFDRNSGEGSIDGFTMPTVGNYPNPNSWKDNSFLSNITPSPTWAGCNGPDTPGAIDCNGNFLGWELQPIAGAPNNGCGWAGLPIVAEELALLGITGQCAPASDGTQPSRPMPPDLL